MFYSQSRRAGRKSADLAVERIIGRELARTTGDYIKIKHKDIKITPGMRPSVIYFVFARPILESLNRIYTKILLLAHRRNGEKEKHEA